MALTLKYQGQRKQFNDTQHKYYYTYFSTEQSEIQTKLNSMSPNLGKRIRITQMNPTQKYGYLTGLKKSQDVGPIWQIEIEYTIYLKDGVQWTTPEGSAYGPKSQTLSVDFSTEPLETHPNYHARWNHYLLQIQQTTPPHPQQYGTVPNFWMNATNTQITEYQADPPVFFKWCTQDTLNDYLTADTSGIKYIDDSGQVWTPKITQQQVQGQKVKVSSPWVICSGTVSGQTGSCTPTKAGYTGYSNGFFTITESQKFTSSSAAGQFVSKKINQQGTPTQGTMGITGGTWLLQGGSVVYDGKHWVATCVYKHSGDQNGWDGQIYTSGHVNNQIFWEGKKI